jgi:DNA-directed RNA polymerase subunit RPC12/RpoP
MVEEDKKPEVTNQISAPQEATASVARMMKYCQNCGAQIDEKAIICPKCGVQVAPMGGNKEPKSRTTAIVLALFLGGIGIHKLYLNEGKWWLYLLFCWTFIPAIIALYELIQYAMMSDEAFHAKYG